MENKDFKNVMNIDLLTRRFSTLHQHTSTIFENRTKRCEDLKEKVNSLLHFQVKGDQSNQNYLGNFKSLKLSPKNIDGSKNENKNIYLNTKYEIVASVCSQIGFNIVAENQDWNILWIDGSISSIKSFKLRRNQRVNHFPGMHEISRKDKLQRNLKIMQRYFFSEYDIFPKTWSLPLEKNEAINFLKDKSNKDFVTFIIKPACSSQGRGIILMKDLNSIFIKGNIICQVYIPNPFLIDGFKFDLRLYVLITSCDPFRIFVYQEGLARFATCLYEKPNSENIDNIYMHLTNYSLQRNSDNFDKDEIFGTKRRATTIFSWFKSHGYDADKIWKSIDDVLIKTMLCVNNSIKSCYETTFPDKFRTSACFELLGFDIILDENLKPYVLEVNHSPSLDTETSLDLDVKTRLLKDTFSIINALPYNNHKVAYLEQMRTAERLYWSRNQFMSSRKASNEFKKILSQMQLEFEKREMDSKNGFRIIYPVLGQSQKYERFFEFNCEHHKDYLNKFGATEEPEHKLYLDSPRHLLPKTLTKGERKVLLNRNLRRNQNIFNQDKLFNLSYLFKNKPIDKCNNVKRSKSVPRKFLLSKKSIKTTTFGKLFTAKSDEFLKLSDATDRTVSSLRNISELLSKSTIDFSTNVNEPDLNEDLFSHLNCESFIILNKKRKIMKNTLTIEETVFTTSTPKVCDIQVSELIRIIETNNLIIENDTLKSTKDNDTNLVVIDLNYNTEEETQKTLAEEIISFQNPTEFLCYLPIIQTQSDLVIFTVLSEDKFERIYSTGFSIYYTDDLVPKFRIHIDKEKRCVHIPVIVNLRKKKEFQELQIIKFIETNKCLESLKKNNFNYNLVEFFDNSSVSKKLHYIKMQNSLNYAYSINNANKSMDNEKWVSNFHKRLYDRSYCIKYNSKPNIMYPLTTYLRNKDCLRSGRKFEKVTSIYNLHLRHGSKLKKPFYLNSFNNSNYLSITKDKNVHYNISLYNNQRKNYISIHMGRYISQMDSSLNKSVKTHVSTHVIEERIFDTNDKITDSNESKIKNSNEINRMLTFKKQRNEQCNIIKEHMDPIKISEMNPSIIKKENYLFSEDSKINIVYFYFARFFQKLFFRNINDAIS